MFENLLQLAADEDRATLTTMAGKYPTLRKYFELGEKVEPVTARLGALVPAYADNFELPVKELEEWHNWKRTAWPSWQADNERVQAAYTDAQIKIAELEATRGTDMDAAEVEAIVAATLKKVGIVDKATLDSTLESFVKDKVGPTLDARVNGLTLRFEDVFDKIEGVIDDHRTTFGESIRPKDVFKYMNDNKISDVEAAYAQMTSGRRAEKTAAQIAAEKKAEYDKGVAEGKKEALKLAGAGRSPVDGGDNGGAARPGPLMRRAQARMPKKADGDVDTSKIPLGKGIARAATQEWYDKKAGAVQ